MAIPLLEQLKIHAQVLVPLVKALQAELGEERANAIVRKALGEVYREFGEDFWRGRESNDVGDNVASAFKGFAGGNALDYEVLRQAPDALDVNVTRCRYAEFYQALGVPELGFLLACNADFDLVKGFGGDVQLTRTQTIMQGATHCDFRYAVNKAE